MAEAPREQALATVHEILSTQMTGVRFWGGEYPQPVTVVRRFYLPAQRSEFPLICVIDGSGSTREFGSTGGVGRYVDHFVIMLYAYVHASDAASRSVQLERLRYDIFLTLARAGPLPLGNIRNFDFGRPEETDQGATDPMGSVAIPVEAVLDDEVQAA